MCGWLSAGGCAPDAFYPTMGDVKQIAEIGRQQLDVHDANMTRQHAVLSPESAGGLQAERAVFERELAELGKKTEALEAAHATMVRDSLALAAKVAALPDGLAASIASTLVPRIEQARDAAAEAKADVQRVETRVEGAAAAAQRAEAEARKWEAEAERRAADAKRLEADTKRVEADTKRVDTDARRIEADARKVQEALNALAASLTDRLAAAGDQTDARLAALRAEVDSWRRSLLEELKLSPDQIERLQGMTTEQIIALIAAALGSAGLGIVSGRTGTSRAEPRLEKLESKVSTLAEEVKLRTPVPA
ncbi:MAG: hypothetical protein C4547_16365 [Phycisphaerales bacterium]|nr:MAG: hypothetical protein C4547_16365 [Phycisphaerales bacterium]